MKVLSFKFLTRLTLILVAWTAIPASATVITYVNTDNNSPIYGHYNFDDATNVFSNESLFLNFNGINIPLPTGDGSVSVPYMEFFNYYTAPGLGVVFSGVSYSGSGSYDSSGMVWLNIEGMSYIDGFNIGPHGVTQWVGNVQFTPTTPVPEPSTYAMMVVGLLGLFGYTRRHLIHAY